MSRTVYVYRLVVISLPEGCDDPDWRPPEGTWEELRSIRKGERDEFGGAWRWPRRRLFTNPETANRTAGKMRQWGAKVEVRQSEPVTWPS